MQLRRWECGCGPELCFSCSEWDKSRIQIISSCFPSDHTIVTEISWKQLMGGVFYVLRFSQAGDAVGNKHQRLMRERRKQQTDWKTMVPIPMSVKKYSSVSKEEIEYLEMTLSWLFPHATMECIMGTSRVTTSCLSPLPPPSSWLPACLACLSTWVFHLWGTVQ
jgi:hypothetical protein